MRKRSATTAGATVTVTAVWTRSIASARALGLLAWTACAATTPVAPSGPDLAGRRAAESLEGPGVGPAVFLAPRPAPRPARAAAPVAEIPAPAALPAPSASSLVASGGSLGPASCSALSGAHALKRSALLRVLDAGLGTWLGGVDVEPKIVRGRFEGWLVRSIHAGESCWAEVDLRPGDVVSRVNHRSVEKPEQAHAVWSALRHAREISVEFVRGAEGHTLKFAIVDDT
jgi:hypothetical protein